VAHLGKRWIFTNAGQQGLEVMGLLDQQLSEVQRLGLEGSYISALSLDRVEQPVSKHLRVRRADASRMLLDCKSSNKSCRAKSCTSKGT
jgi:hypothetical protein